MINEASDVPRLRAEIERLYGTRPRVIVEDRAKNAPPNNLRLLGPEFTTGKPCDTARSTTTVRRYGVQMIWRRIGWFLERRFPRLWGATWARYYCPAHGGMVTARQCIAGGNCGCDNSDVRVR